jgi:hypothetical protein
MEQTSQITFKNVFVVLYSFLIFQINSIKFLCRSKKNTTYIQVALTICGICSISQRSFFDVKPSRKEQEIVYKFQSNLRSLENFK